MSLQYSLRVNGFLIVPTVEGRDPLTKSYTMSLQHSLTVTGLLIVPTVEGRGP